MEKPKQQWAEKRWTKERHERFLVLYKQGASVHFIAKRCQARPSTIKTKITLLSNESLGGKRVHWTDEEEQTMMDLVSEGFTSKQIARKIGRTPAAVDNHLSQAGVHRGYHKWKSTELRALRNAIEKLSVQYGIPARTIVFKLRKMEWNLMT
jgi:DNA-binding NarL/FixJ family response regulator